MTDTPRKDYEAGPRGDYNGAVHPSHEAEAAAYASQPEEAIPEDTDPEQFPPRLKQALLAALIAVVGINGYAQIFGIGSGPKASHDLGVELNDTDANRELMCLREKFHEMAEGIWGRAVWMEEHCDTDALDKLTDTENPLQSLAQARRHLLSSQGLPGQLEKWEGTGSGEDPLMYISVDREKAAEAARARRIKQFTPYHRR